MQDLDFGGLSEADAVRLADVFVRWDILALLTAP